jgi:uncharacterized protein YwgA
MSNQRDDARGERLVFQNSLKDLTEIHRFDAVVHKQAADDLRREIARMIDTSKAASEDVSRVLATNGRAIEQLITLHAADRFKSGDMDEWIKRLKDQNKGVIVVPDRKKSDS